ncbi:MAG: stage II sporulation protein P, partial [Clostridia bacterium]|nr:stage II sporulation protein P [Clostridia bacterium]
AAQVMLVMGSETGSIKDHPNWKQNLILATKLQYCMEDSYPQLARSVLLRSAKYNQDLSNGSILIEMGSDANTFDEAIYSGELVGEALVKLLDSQM